MAIALALPAGLVPSRAWAAVPADVCARIDDVAREFPGRLAYSLVDLDGGVTCGARANEEFLTASLYKLFVLAAAYQERERGTLSFAEPLAIRADEATDDPPELRVERAPQVTVAEAIRLMVQVSDNPSAAALRERLGVDVVAAMPVRLGLRDTHLGEQYTSTAADIARCFALLHAGRVVSADASREMVEVLRGEFFTAGLADGMPEGTPFAHKIGT
ncbi:MAG: serine hydrolase, partial [Dehalococcoidia bacterium]